MAKPSTEIIHDGRLIIRRNGKKFGTLWIDKQNIAWRTRSGKKYPTRAWKDFDDFMTRSGKFADT
jgi:hypothetical protein